MNANTDWLKKRMHDKIAIILPVRDAGLERHERLVRCLESYYEMTEGLSDIHLLHDEDECDTYHPIAEQYPEIINYCIPTGITLMQKINIHAIEIASKYKYIGFIGDDIVFRTQFESSFIRYLSSVPYGLVFGNDFIWGKKKPTHPFITSNAVLAVGFFGCPAVSHNFFDDYWHLVFSNLTHIEYQRYVIMEHMHPIMKKAPIDSLAIKISGSVGVDEPKFWDYIKNNLDKDLDKIEKFKYEVIQ